MHIVGKGILRFHAIYWPGMLLSAGLPLPSLVRACMPGSGSPAGPRTLKTLNPETLKS